jgi:succinate-acetate transporter protein
MLNYNPRHVSSINMPIFRRTNCIIIASGIVTLCKRLCGMSDDSKLQSSLLSMIIQFVLLKMGMLMLETCRGL